MGPVLYGSVSEWIIQYKKGLRKFNNFERLLEQDPTGAFPALFPCASDDTDALTDDSMSYLAIKVKSCRCVLFFIRNVVSLPPCFQRGKHAR